MIHRLDGVAVFVQAVEAGNFAGAALRLNLSRSAVSKAIARLEKRLGTRLFHRTPRHQSLTDDGQAYYEHCIRALAELEAAETALDSGKHKPRGRLRVSTPVLFGRHCVAPVLLALTRKYAELEMEICFSDHEVDLLAEKIDLAIRIGSLPDSTILAARQLGTQRFAICAAPSYLASHGRPHDITALDDHMGIAYLRHRQAADWVVLDAQGKPVFVRTKTRIYLDDMLSIADAAVSGMGLAYLPCWLLPAYLADGRLEVVLDSGHTLPTPIHAIWPQTHRLPSKTRTAIDTLLAELPRRLQFF